MNAPFVSQQPVDDFGLRFSSLTYSATLTASVDTILLIPDSSPSFKAVMRSNGEVWVAINAVHGATLPSAPADDSGSLNTVNSEMFCNCCHLCREVRAGDTLHFITGTSCDVSVVLYSLRTNN